MRMRLRSSDKRMWGTRIGHGLRDYGLVVAGEGGADAAVMGQSDAAGRDEQGKQFPLLINLARKRAAQQTAVNASESDVTQSQGARMPKKSKTPRGTIWAGNCVRRRSAIICFSARQPGGGM